MGEEKIIDVYHEFDLNEEVIDYFSANPNEIDEISKKIYKDLLTCQKLDLSFIDVDIEYEEVDPDELQEQIMAYFIITFSAKIIIPPGEEEEDGKEEYLTNLMYEIMQDFPYHNYFDNGYEYGNGENGYEYGNGENSYIRKIPFIKNENGQWEIYNSLLNKPSKLRRR